MTAHPSVRLARDARRRNHIGFAFAVCFWVAAMAVAVPAMRLPAHVDRLTVDNPHPWAINLDVTDADGSRWLGVGTVEREQEQTFPSVLDQGDEWTIRFSYSGVHVDVSMTGFQLEQRGWHVTVPDELAGQLRAAGVPVTPY